MDYDRLLETASKSVTNDKQTVPFDSGLDIEAYPFSIRRLGDIFFFIGTRLKDKGLFLLYKQPDAPTAGRFNGTLLKDGLKGGWSLKNCLMIHSNAEMLREKFPFLRARILGTANSIGTGDRLGLANPGHIRAVKGSGLLAVLAQQSIRELTRTQRKPEDVMDSASWAAFQEGFEEGFGADADHLKTAADVDLLVAAGFTMYTIDPGEHVNNAADKLIPKDVQIQIDQLKWKDLEDTHADCLRRYAAKSVLLPGDFRLTPTAEQVSRALVKYGRAIAHIHFLYKHLHGKKSGEPFELEASVDETESVTSPFEHYFIASELRRLGVSFVSLAPRFIGDFEKGIDYKGDLKTFETEYRKHVSISMELGPYKISLHSGSDKFSLYPIMAGQKNGTLHVKTAGTSWLVALQTISMTAPDLFREIFDFAKQHYPADRQSYFVSGRLEDVPLGKDIGNGQLPDLFDQNAARQVLHVTFGSVMTAVGPDGREQFRQRILGTLKDNETRHYENLVNHIRKHVQPFIR
ncbi:MAG TPA: tagaturonate epimerase family protein [bacterium]